MNFIKLSFFALLLLTTTCFSQSDTETDITDITKVTILNPGLSYEKRIAKFQSLYAQIFLNTSAFIGYSSSFGFNSGIYFDPAFTIQYRYYYNSAKRETKGKRTEMNSLNYVAAIINIVYSKNRLSSEHYVENNQRAINKFGLAWGFQRNYKKRFSLDFNLGPGILFAKATLPGDTGPVIKNVVQFTGVGQLNLGFWLNKRKI